MKLSLTFLLLSIALFSISNEKIKFGKIDKSYLEMQSYDKDSSAVALILYDYGNNTIEYRQDTGWKLIFTRHQRIKILKKEGVNWADFQVHLYKSGTEAEELNNLKAITYNLVDNKIEKSELNKKDVLAEDVNKHNDLKSFTLPDVQVGSVIEVKYSIDCKTFFRNMRTWYFQHSIPILYSEYEVVVPEYFYFRKFGLGFENFSLQDETVTNAMINLTTKTRVQTGSGMAGVVRTEHNYDRINFKNTNYHWVAEDLPAFEEEAYVSSVDNYIQQIQFELQSAKFPNSKLYTYSESWESINTNLTEDDDFGGIIFGNTNFLKEKAEELIAGAADDKERILRILNYVHNNFKFNGSFSIYSKGLRKVQKDLNGNVADINFYLGALLQAVDFDVKPVVLSTRANGTYLFPTVTGFNYVVLQCKIGENKILLDGANKYCGINEVPFFCLNGNGLIVGGSKPEWVDFYEIGNSEIRYVSQMAINPGGELEGTLSILRNGYSANTFRNKVGAFVSTDEYLEDFAEKKTDWEIDDHVVENIDVLDQAVSEKIRLKLNNKCIVAGDRIYLSPILINPEINNPFKLKERKYPVDFGYKFKDNNISILTIPEGYVIEELPEEIKISLPDQKVVFLFGITRIGDNTVQVVSSVNFNQPIFLAEDYENLKVIYNRIIEKHKQQIILKKI